MVECPAPDVVNALLANRLDVETRATLADHAAGCEDCHQLISALVAPVAPPCIGRYEIERTIGAGAMGVVYAARDPELARRIAIKVLRGAGSEARLRREAQALAQLSHPNVVAVYDVGEHDGRTFVAMALVDGENLRAWLARPREQAEILRVLRDAAAGLAAAHAAGMIHRDLKPDNIFVGKDGSVQVGDFGLARSDGELDPGASASGQLTQTGMVLGTPAYMAPEHADGEPTMASDQFSFAVTAWEALYGARPFEAKTYRELREKIVARDFTPTQRPVPARIRAVLERALAAEPAERWPSIAALRDALAPPRKRWPFVAAGALVLGAAGTLVLAWPGRTNCAGDLDRVWTPAARQALAGEPLVAAYARDWTALSHDSCHDELRTRCLGRARDSLAALVGDVKPDTDPTIVHRAVLALPSLADCKSPLVGSASPQQVRDGEQLLAKIVEADVRFAIGGETRPGELAALVQQADALGYEPAIVEAALTAAKVPARAGRVDEAAALQRHAMTVAEASHDDLRVAEAGADLAELLVRSNHLDEAAGVIDLASSAVQRAGGDTSLAVRVGSVRALLASAKGDHAGAIAIAESILAPTAAQMGSGSEEMAAVYSLLSREYASANRYDDARAAMSHVEQIMMTRVKGQPAAVVASLSTRIDNALIAGDGELVRAFAQQLIALAHEVHDPGIELEAQQSIALSYELEQDFAHMVEANKATLALLDKQPDGGARDIRASASAGIGTGYVGLGQASAAIEPLHEAIDLYVKLADADARASATVVLGDALLATGKTHEARELLEPLVHELVEATDVRPQRRASAEWGLARALWDDGGARDRDRAKALAADAKRDYTTAIGNMQKIMLVVVPRFQAKLSAIEAWQNKHE